MIKTLNPVIHRSGGYITVWGARVGQTTNQGTSLSCVSTFYPILATSLNCGGSGIVGETQWANQEPL